MILIPKSKILSQAGDTIIEVIIGIVVLSVVMAAAYISTTHSLQLGTDAGNRNRALGFAQQQIEQIKFAEQQNNLTPYTSVTQPFCTNPANGNIIQVSPGSFCGVCVDNTGQPQAYIDPANSSCPSGSQNLYSEAVSYNSATKTFTVDAQWAASNGNGMDQLSLYYKLAG